MRFLTVEEKINFEEKFDFEAEDQISVLHLLPNRSHQIFMTGATDAPEALWYWQTDQGHWHVYSDALCESLEDAWKNKVTRFPVDAERFVDTVKMVQRRLDMTGKQRSVKRELQLALLKHVFAFAGPLKTNVAPLVSDHGGIITPYITTKVRHSIFALTLLFLQNLS